MSRRMRPRKRIRFLLLTQLSFSGCFGATPFQSARVAEPGRRVGSISVQRSRPADGEADPGWTMVEAGTRIPLGDGRADLGVGAAFVGYDRRGGTGGGGGGVLFALGPKFELVDDVLAVELPVRVMFAGAGTFHTIHAYPRAILSIPLHPNVEVNLSATKFFFPTGDGAGPWGYAAGLALGPRGGAIVRPEIGVLRYADGERMFQFGIGFTPEFPELPASPGPEGAGTPH